MRPLRLLYVTAEPHPSFRADVRVLFGKYLPRLGVHSDLLTLALPGQLDQPWPAGRSWLTPRPQASWRRLLRQARQDLRLFVLAGQGYDAVLVRDRILAGAIGLLAARRAGIPFYYWASYPKPEMRRMQPRSQGLGGGLKWCLNQLRGRLSGLLLHRWLLPRADHVFVQSEAMREVYAARGLRLQDMTAVPMGVDTEALAPRRPLEPAWAARLQGRRVVVYAGALDAVRQPGLMLEALRGLVGRWPELLLLLVGGAAQAEEELALRRRCSALGLDGHVLFTGWVDTDSVHAFVRAAELGLSMIPRGPLYDVSSPTKLAEYLALGLPVLANDLPDQARLLAEAGAGPTVDWSAQALALAIEQRLMDMAQSKRWALAGQRHVLAHRSYSALADKLARTLRRLQPPEAPR